MEKQSRAALMVREGEGGSETRNVQARGVGDRARTDRSLFGRGIWRGV